MLRQSLQRFHRTVLIPTWKVYFGFAIGHLPWICCTELIFSSCLLTLFSVYCYCFLCCVVWCVACSVVLAHFSPLHRKWKSWWITLIMALSWDDNAAALHDNWFVCRSYALIIVFNTQMVVSIQFYVNGAMNYQNLAKETHCSL